jgi:hypothetical protein
LRCEDEVAGAGADEDAVGYASLGATSRKRGEPVAEGGRHVHAWRRD